KRSNRWLTLRKQTGLYLFGDRQVVRSLAFRLQPDGLGAALCFQRARRLIELNQRKLFPSTSSKTAYLACPLPQEGSIGGIEKRTPRLDHSSNTLCTSSVRKLNPVFCTIRWCSGDPSAVTSRAIPGKAEPTAQVNQPAAGG